MNDDVRQESLDAMSTPAMIVAVGFKADFTPLMRTLKDIRTLPEIDEERRPKR